MQRPQIFGAGLSVGMLAGILIGWITTVWLGRAAISAIQRSAARPGGKKDAVRFELLLQ